MVDNTMARILQLTDLHVFSEPHATLKGIPTRESLQEVVEFILQTEAAFDQVIVTGDHTHDELATSYQAVREILTPFADRLWQVPGNHDDRSVLREVFFRNISGTGDQRINFQFTQDNWLCLGLDTHVPGEVAGCINESQISWLTSQLEKSSASRVALFFHHPPVEVGSQWMDRIGLSGRDLLQQVIESDDRIRLVCSGHVHHEFQFRIGAAEILTTPSTGIQFDPAGDSPRFEAAAPGFRVIEFDGDEYSTRVVRLPNVKYVPKFDE